MVFALFAGSIVLILAIVFGAPELGEKADPTLIQAHPKPDWYFLWLYALAALIPPELEIVMTLGMGAVGFLLVILPFIAPFGERRASRRPWGRGGRLCNPCYRGPALGRVSRTVVPCASRAPANGGDR